MPALLHFVTNPNLLILIFLRLTLSVLFVEPQKITCDTSLRGFATLGAGTTGGGDTTPITVTTAQELRTACNGTQPRVVMVSGIITTGPIPIKVGSNKSIIGLSGATINGGLSMINGTSNIIIRYLTIKGAGMGNLPEDTVAGRGTSNVWIDHCNLSDAGDGLLDMTKGSDLITVSWTKFWYTDVRDDRVAITFGATLNDGDLDRGKLRVTFLGNHFSTNVTEGMARVRYGHAHFVNNLYNAPDNYYAIGVATESSILVENNVFLEMNNPIKMRDRNGTAYVTETGNMYINTFGDRVSGLVQGKGAPFSNSPFPSKPVPFKDIDQLTKPPYTMDPIPANQVEHVVRSCADVKYINVTSPV